MSVQLNIYSVHIYLHTLCGCGCVFTRLTDCSVFRPEVCDNKHQITIRDGRHPAIDLLMGEHNQYVPNHTELQVNTHTHTQAHSENFEEKKSQAKTYTDICLLANALRAC